MDPNMPSSYYPPLTTVNNLVNLVNIANDLNTNSDIKKVGALTVLILGTITTIALAILAPPLAAVVCAVATLAAVAGLLCVFGKDETAISNIDLLFKTANSNDATYNNANHYGYEYDVKSLIKVKKDDNTDGYYFVTHQSGYRVQMAEVTNNITIKR